MTGTHAEPSPAVTDGHLTFPRERHAFEGRALLFRWDFRHTEPRPTRYRLTIRPLAPDQTPEAAIRANPAAYEAVIDRDCHASFGVEWLKVRAPDFVWQVVALDGDRVVATSTVGRFTVERAKALELPIVCTEADFALAGHATPMPSGGQRGDECACCPNGGLESGDFTGWQGWYGQHISSPYIYLNNLTAGFHPTQHEIVSAGSDTNVNIPKVSLGNYAAKIGGYYEHGEVTGLSYTFTVTPQNQYFGFRYAVVLEDGEHPAVFQPFFTWYLKKGPSIFYTFPQSSPHGIITGGQVVATTGSPAFSWAHGVAYRNWTPVCVDLSDHVGETMTLVLFVASCMFHNGHYGYAYIDGLCQPNLAVPAFAMTDQICGSGTLWANGSASQNETSYAWSIEETDANGTSLSAAETFWFDGQVGNTNLTALYATHGKRFLCNSWYRVRLTVFNDCTPGAQIDQRVYIKCPPVTAGPDACVSCTPNGRELQLGVGNSTDPALTYNWSPAVGLDDPTSPSPTHAQGSVAYPITYTVTVTDSGGCTNTDQVTLFCQKPGGRITLREACCHAVLTMNATGGYSNITWSTGQTGVESIMVTEPGVYTAVLGSACGTFTAQITVPSLAGVSGPFNPVAAESVINPTNTSSVTPVMHIKDVIVGSPAGIAGVPGAYNATDYELLIFDRWGNLIRTVVGSNCTGFTNWSIQWDGRNDNGTIVQQDTYSWRLRFRNCDRKDWELAKVRRIEKRCIKWFTVFGKKLWCTKWEYFFFDDGNGIGSVSVVH